MMLPERKITCKPRRGAGSGRRRRTCGAGSHQPADSRGKNQALKGRAGGRDGQTPSSPPEVRPMLPATPPQRTPTSYRPPTASSISGMPWHLWIGGYFRFMRLLFQSRCGYCGGIAGVCDVYIPSRADGVRARVESGENGPDAAITIAEQATSMDTRLIQVSKGGSKRTRRGT